MYGIKSLKRKIVVKEETVSCPVKDCNEFVDRQRNYFRKEENFKCPIHDIYISPTTFEYNNELDNILWKNKEDLNLLNNIKKVKRESRLGRDNSEDALTWNVFRFLENNNLISELLQNLINIVINNSNIIYWSYSQVEDDSWSELNKARTEFGESIKRSSEPDIIINTDKTLFFIEAKLTAGNKTQPNNKNNNKNYIEGGNGWFNKVFNFDYQTIAIEEKKYELLRFWLLGTWLANNLNKNFYLLNLVPSRKELSIEKEFKKFIIENNNYQFIRYTWEDIYNYVITKKSLKNKSVFTNYIENKTIGYNHKGIIKKAFSI